MSLLTRGLPVVKSKFTALSVRNHVYGPPRNPLQTYVSFSLNLSNRFMKLCCFQLTYIKLITFLNMLSSITKL